MDPPNYYPLSDKNSRKLSTTAHHTNNALSHPSATTASTPAAATTTTTTPQIARPRSLAENHRPNIISMPPTAASKTSYTPKKQPGKAAAAAHERRIINNNSLQQQQLPYNNMLLSGLNTSTILASESSSITPLTTKAFFDTAAAATTTTTTTAAAAAAAAIPPRPRRLWKVLDTKIPKYPVLYYPPPNPYTSCILTDDTTTPPPSVIAIRIAECLLQRNVCVEYDEETATATVLTVDRCVMQIHLWRLSSTCSTHAATAGSSSSSSTMTGAILVECIRTSGPVQTFHWTTQAVLQAAQGLDSGVDRRATRASRHRPYLATSSSSSSSSSLLSSSSLEYVRYSDYDKKNKNKNSTTTTSKAYNNDDGVEEDEQYDDDDDDDEYVSTLLPSRTNNNNNSTNNKNPDAMAATALETLEYAYSLITKDRLDAQQLGMEWLVSLTDTHAVGVDAALYHALALLGGMPMPMRTSSSLSSSPSLSSILYALIVDKQAPNEQQQQQQHDDDDEEEEAESPTRQTEPLRRRRRVFRPGFPSFAASSNNDDDDDDDNDNDNNNNNSSESVYPYQDHHASFLRSMALRVLVNALTLLSKHQRTVLESLLLSSSSSSRHGNLWTSQDLIQALTDDLQGASRPPTAVLHGTGRLASCHEACLAIQCLGVLARHNVEAQRKILQNDATLTWLERARTVGRSTNMALYEQAEQVYTFLTETERSC